ncbi:hypothetical protein FRB91_011890 [Serendipita sp. 411]|nr:hypothetical protein FRC15_003763 [Serendipita sp. 397]KAG8803984.1 hypothetical protein FRC16_001701 [Serendipita sp. 398]KAG8847339.1 hypothetical protein FRB91_011890 [Serendipita sp. 411]KAG8876309.1 hypothetical protein FRC20_001812 [Serendipita sp. 405]
MLKSFFDGLASGSHGLGQSGGATEGGNSNTNSSSNSKGATPAQLRADIYTCVDQISIWIASGKAENGIDYRSTLAIIERHFPGTQVNLTTDEVAVLVGGLTNMIFEFSKADGISGAMAFRTFTDKLLVSWNSIEDKEKKIPVGEGIIRGLNQIADPGLATREFAPRVQMVGSLKNLTAAVYGKGSAEARNADVVWQSRFI